MGVRVLKIEYLTWKQWYKHFRFCKSHRYIVFAPREKEYRNYMIANLEIKAVSVKLTYRRNNKTICYVSRMDDGDSNQKISGLRAYTTMCQNLLPWHIPNLREREVFGFHKSVKGVISWKILPTIQFMFYNKELSGHRYEDCYGYDRNSAFTWAMMQPIPNTEETPLILTKTKKGQIGFNLDGTVCFEPGHLCNFVFNEMESPFIKFAQKWFLKKRDAKTVEDKEKAKQTLNFCIGYMHRTNPFIRNCIVARSNNFIKNLIDEDTLYCNTDSIVSRKKRTDLNLGRELGQWKIEHQGDFAFKEFSYQWNDAIPIYRGIPKQWFLNFEKAHGRFWDLLIDPLPTAKYNGYIWDEESFDFKKVKWEEAEDAQEVES